MLEREERAQVDEQLAGRIETMGDRELAGAAASLAARLDPASVARRRGKAEEERAVTIRPAPDTMTYVTALLPVAQGVAVHAALSREAASKRAAGDPRSQGQVMADTLVERLTGQASAAAVPAAVTVVLSDAALLTGADDDALLAPAVHGGGAVTPIPAELARELVLASLTQTTQDQPEAALPGARPAAWSPWSPPHAASPPGWPSWSGSATRCAAPRGATPRSVTPTTWCPTTRAAPPPSRTPKGSARPATTPNKPPAGPPDPARRVSWTPRPPPATATDHSSPPDHHPSPPAWRSGSATDSPWPSCPRAPDQSVSSRDALSRRRRAGRSPRVRASGRRARARARRRPRSAPRVAVRRSCPRPEVRC